MVPFRVFLAVIPCRWSGRSSSSGKEPVGNSSVTPMLRHLLYKIKSTGPITVAEYMREVLTNPAQVRSGAGGQGGAGPGRRGAFQGRGHPEGGGGYINLPVARGRRHARGGHKSQRCSGDGGTSGLT